MIRPSLVRSVAAVCLLSGCAMVSGSVAAAPGETAWRCSAPNGTFRNHDVPVADTATQFTGEMVFRHLDDSVAWRPVARLGFVDLADDAPDCGCNGISVVWYREYPKVFVVSLLSDGEKTQLGSVPVENPVTYKVTYAADGALRLEVGTGAVTARSPRPRRNALHMSCSSADVDVRVTEVR